MKYNFLCSVALGLLLTGGCAWYDMTPISKEDLATWGEDSKGHQSKDGYIFNQPELYFAATITQVTSISTNKETSTKQDVTVTPLYLPNPNKAYRVQTHTFLAKAGYTFTCTDGWKLNQIGDSSDTTTVASSLAGQLSTLITAAASVAKNIASTAPKTNIVVF